MGRRRARSKTKAKVIGAVTAGLLAAAESGHAATLPAHHRHHHPAGITAPTSSTQVGRWIRQAARVMEAHGIPSSKINRGDIAIIIAGESGGNRNAVNLTDSNAAAGHPSKGLTQTIPATFAAHCLPGYCGDIYNPVDNIIAGVRYALGRYGSLDNVPGVIAVRNGQPYVGY